MHELSRAKEIQQCPAGMRQEQAASVRVRTTNGPKSHRPINWLLDRAADIFLPAANSITAALALFHLLSEF